MSYWTTSNRSKPTVQIEYKAGVMRAELIRLNEVLDKAANTAMRVIELKEEHNKKSFLSSLWGKRNDGLPDVSLLTFSMISESMKGRLRSMIHMCDEAVDNQLKLLVDHDDLQFIDQLKKLEGLVRNVASN
jgi:hypothetical protein